jgi:DNA-binding transcriptional ArsR family regulator
METMNRHSPQIRVPARLAGLFKVLGDPTRLRIFEFLTCCSKPVAIGRAGDVRPIRLGARGPGRRHGERPPRDGADPIGPTVGEICCRITGTRGVTSTFSHHLKELRTAGLITVQRRGRHMICAANPEVLAALARYFERFRPGDDDDCCKTS